MNDGQRNLLFAADRLSHQHHPGIQLWSLSLTLLNTKKGAAFIKEYGITPSGFSHVQRKSTKSVSDQRTSAVVVLTHETVTAVVGGDGRQEKLTNFTTIKGFASK